MPLRWTDPDPEDSCPQCWHWNGTVFDDGMELPLPAHPHCDCYYQPHPGPADSWDWNEIPDEARTPWGRYTAYLLRTHQTIPAVLQQLEDGRSRTRYFARYVAESILHVHRPSVFAIGPERPHAPGFPEISCSTTYAS